MTELQPKRVLSSGLENTRILDDKPYNKEGNEGTLDTFAAVPRSSPPVWNSASCQKMGLLYPTQKLKVMEDNFSDCCCTVSQSWLISFVTTWTAAHQAPVSVEFSRQEYWSGLPILPPGDLPNPGIKFMSPALQAASLLLSDQGSPLFQITRIYVHYSQQWPFASKKVQLWEMGQEAFRHTLSVRFSTS